MGCDCCGGPIHGPASGNATTAKYTTDGEILWWFDSGRARNGNVVIGNTCYEVSWELSGTPVITQLDSDGFPVRSVTTNHTSVISNLQVVDDFLLCISISSQSSPSMVVYVTKYDPATLTEIWSFNQQNRRTGYSGIGVDVTVGDSDTIYILDRISSVDKVHKYSSGSLQWTINASNPGGGNVIDSFGPRFAGGDMAFGGTTVCGWLYDATPSIVDTWDPGTATITANLTTVDPDGVHLWIADAGLNVYRLDTSLNDTFTPPSGWGSSRYVSAEYGALYGIAATQIQRCSDAGVVTARVTGLSSASDFITTGDQQFLIVKANNILRKYDDSAAPATLLWTLNPTFAECGGPFTRHELSVDLSGNIYTSGLRVSSGTLDKTPS